MNIPVTKKAIIISKLFSLVFILTFPFLSIVSLQIYKFATNSRNRYRIITNIQTQRYFEENNKQRKH